MTWLWICCDSFGGGLRCLPFVLGIRLDVSVSAEMTSPQPRTIGSSLTAAQRKGIRAQLVADLQDARNLETRLKGDVAAGIESRRGSTNDEVDDPEGASLAFEGAQSNAMLQHTVRHAQEISAALVRLDAGSYGVCERCGGAIPVGRLEARPSTSFCISCAA